MLACSEEGHPEVRLPFGFDFIIVLLLLGSGFCLSVHEFPVLLIR